MLKEKVSVFPICNSIEDITAGYVTVLHISLTIQSNDPVLLYSLLYTSGQYGGAFGVSRFGLILSEQLGYPERCHNHCFNFNCFRLHLLLYVVLFEKMLVVFHFTKRLRLSSISKKIEVVFHIEIELCRLPF